MAVHAQLILCHGVNQSHQQVHIGNLRLSNNVAYSPCPEAIMNILLPEADLGAREILCVCRLVQTNLHRHLHHKPTEHEGGVGGRSICREGPCAEQA